MSDSVETLLEYRDADGRIDYIIEFRAAYPHPFHILNRVHSVDLLLTPAQARALADALTRKLDALAQDAELPPVRENSNMPPWLTEDKDD